MHEKEYNTSNVEFIVKESKVKLIDDSSVIPNNSTIFVVVAQTKNAVDMENPIVSCSVIPSGDGKITVLFTFDPVMLTVVAKQDASSGPVTIQDMPVAVPAISEEDKRLLEEALAFVETGSFVDDEDENEDDEDTNEVW
jgi:hypothetical protein